MHLRNRWEDAVCRKSPPSYMPHTLLCWSQVKHSKHSKVQTSMLHCACNGMDRKLGVLPLTKPCMEELARLSIVRGCITVAVNQVLTRQSAPSPVSACHFAGHRHPLPC